MKLSIWLFVVSLLTSVSAYSDPGAYERLWYYYAYTLDTAGNKVAPGCSGSAAGKRCTFAEFMKYIDVSPENMLNTLENVDPTDVPKAVRSLVLQPSTAEFLMCDSSMHSWLGITRVLTGATSSTTA